MDLLDFHQGAQDFQDFPDLPDLPDLPPHAPQLRREGHWEPEEIPRMRVSELKQRLTAALHRTNTPLTFKEKEDIRAVLDDVSQPHVRMDDEYEIPNILPRVESIPLGANRGIIGNGGARKKRMRSLRKKSLRKTLRALRKRTLRKKHSF